MLVCSILCFRGSRSRSCYIRSYYEVRYESLYDVQTIQIQVEDDDEQHSGRAYSRHQAAASVSEVRTYVFMYRVAKRQVASTLAACRSSTLLTNLYLAPHASTFLAVIRIIQGTDLHNPEPGEHARRSRAHGVSR